MNSKYYLAISDSTVQRSPQITSGLIEFSSVLHRHNLSPSGHTHTHKSCTGHCSEQFYPANFSVICFSRSA